ncbi:AraC family transcriptional regulator [Paenibacillus psychroresistens]|uniref:AraC family transcriptional regulator n=1 Tax=Paenibacillus psychroresistens TaxID=1778678 RepID=A0A6B8RBJ9_9BACL|nr:AraC family transcriptional regulator [Paenibacillus psychroresistens]QGQ93941.1 AraC family transcriptional regulator [Paenibacillus psychroresistens]
MSEIDSVNFEDISMVQVGSIVYLPHANLGPRNKQESLQLIFIHSGWIDVQLDGGLERLSVGPGNVVLLEPARVEYFEFSKKSSTWHRWVDIGLNRLTIEMKKIFTSLPKVIPLSEEMQSITDLMLAFERKGLTSSHSSLRALGLASYELFVKEAFLLPVEIYSHPAIMAVQDYIHRHYETQLRVAELASHVGISQEHLIRLYKKHTGFTPAEYMWKYRGSKAIELIENTGMKIREVSELCGFGSEYHFTRFIRERYGESPTSIRKAKWRI